MSESKDNALELFKVISCCIRNAKWPIHILGVTVKNIDYSKFPRN